MPSRVVRGEINRSDSLSKVSRDAELTFRALLHAVDDFGRLDARPTILKAELFPVRAEITPEQVMGWVRELASIDEPVPPVVLYEANGRPYLALTGHERHRGKGRRAETSRYPDPPILGNPGNPRIPEESSDPLENPQNPPGGKGVWGYGSEGNTTGGECEGGAAPLPAEPADIPGGNSTAAKNRAPPIPDRWVDAVARINAVFRLYDGPRIRRVGPTRGKRFAVIDREYGALAEIASKAIHGYVCRHGTKDREDFAARKYFELDSILAPSHLDANLQACEDAIERGHSKPFRRGDHTRNAKAREPPETPAAVARQVSESLKQSGESHG